MKKVSKHNFENNKNFPYKTEELLAISDDIINAINDWSKQTRTIINFCLQRRFMNEQWLQFSFRTEEELSMFILRWDSVFKEDYQDSYHLNMMKIMEQVNHRAEELIGKVKDDPEE